MRLNQRLHPMVKVSGQEARTDKAHNAMGRDTRKRNM